MFQFAFNVEGDHPGTACALPLHQLMLGVRRQTWQIDREKRVSSPHPEFIIRCFFLLSREHVVTAC